jgi:MtrB/PioB family decaheme-associated outer membrane protein
MKLKQGMWLVAFAAAALGLGARAADADDGQLRGEVEGSALWFVESDPPDSAKFEQYREVPSGLVLDHLLLDWWNDQGWHVWFDAEDLLEDDQRLDLRFGKLDLWKLEIDWKENPRRYSDSAHQLWTHQGDGVFTLEDSLQSALESAPGSSDGDGDGEWDDGTRGAIMRDAIASSASEVDLGYQRETGRATFEVTPIKELRLGISFERDERTGTMPQNLGAYFSDPFSEVAAPVDWQTDTLSAWAEYRRRHWNAGVRYTVSEFDTKYDRLLWDNQLSLEDSSASSPGAYQMNLGTDNEYEQFQAWFGANLPGSTRINLDVSEAWAEQDDEFLPKTVNSMLGVTPLGVSRFDGQHEYNTYSLRVSSHPLPWLGLRGWWRQYEFNDDSTSYVFQDYGEVDRAVGDSRRNLPYSYDRTNWGLSPSFSPADWVTFALSYENVSTDREHAAVEDTDEDILRLTLDLEVASWLWLRASAQTQDRESARFDPDWHEESFPEGESIAHAINEGHREYFWADRDREVYDIMADFTPMETLSIYLQGRYAESDYSDPNTGIDIGGFATFLEDRDGDGVAEPVDILYAGRQSDREQAATLGLSWAPNEDFTIFADHTWEKIDWEMASRYRGVSGGVGTDDARDDWFTDVVDRYRTFTLGFDVRWADGLWRATGDVVYSQGKGDIHTAYAIGGSLAGDTDTPIFPQLETELTILDLHFTRELPGGWTVGLRYWYEDWEDDNWQTDYMEPYMGNPDQDPGTSASAFLGVDFDDYENHILMVTARYEF